MRVGTQGERVPADIDLMRALRLLIADDSPPDAELIAGALAGAGVACSWTLAETEEQFVAALADPPDAIVCDYHMPRFSPARAAELLRASGLDCPLVVVSGMLDESQGAKLIESTAHDFVRKDRLDRLPVALQRELRAAEDRRKLRASLGAPANARATRIEQALRLALQRDAFERHALLRENERLAEQARLAIRRLAEANAELERRVAQKTAALSEQLALFRVSQEALDRLPLGVVGVDAEGMIAAANEYAVLALGAAPGSAALDCLSGPLREVLACARARGGEARGVYEDHAIVCRPMGAASAARGTLLVAVPAVV